LNAHREGRRYIGIEMNKEYADDARQGHAVIAAGGDPFAKDADSQKREVCAVSKRALQLDVVQVAEIVDHIPTRDELAAHSTHPIELFDKAFPSWYQATLAAKKAGFAKAA
jgi:hypothetical protein